MVGSRIYSQKPKVARGRTPISFSDGGNLATNVWVNGLLCFTLDRKGTKVRNDMIPASSSPSLLFRNFFVMFGIFSFELVFFKQLHFCSSKENMNLKDMWPN